jgi:hypothetical protein
MFADRKVSCDAGSRHWRATKGHPKVQVLTTASDVTSCKLQSCFGGSYCIHFQGTTLSCLSLFYPADGHNTFLRNVANDLPDYIAFLENLTNSVNTIRTKAAFHVPLWLSQRWHEVCLLPDGLFVWLTLRPVKMQPPPSHWLPSTELHGVICHKNGFCCRICDYHGGGR